MTCRRRDPGSALAALLAVGVAAQGGCGSAPREEPPPAHTFPATSYVPARIRRLSTFEIEATVTALFTKADGFQADLPGDFRAGEFTQNAAQQVDSIFAGQLRRMAESLGRDNAVRAIAHAGCSPSGGAACASAVMNDFGARAYRRPLTGEEARALMSTFEAGQGQGAFQDGIALVISTILQSASFLYVTEIGDAPSRDGVSAMTEYEIASALSYLLTGGPPDQPLLDAAAAHRLRGGSEREHQARRLLEQPGAHAQLGRFVKEWLGLDQLDHTDKDANAYPAFADLRSFMIAETSSFIDEVLWNDDGTLATLLAADYTVADAALAAFYGLQPPPGATRVSVDGSSRRGILTQGAFLSVFAHADETAPVKRGSAILRRLLCVELPLPGEIGLTVVPPVPDPTKTTRQRFAIHSSDPLCAGCHGMMDPIGFAFEALDGMGGLRDAENGQPVDTLGDVSVGDVAGPVAGAAELAGRLGASDDVRRCFARHVFRFAAAEVDADHEDTFVTGVWSGMDDPQRAMVKEVFVALAASELFVLRRAQ
jgi:hypothetical protein